MPLNQFLVYPLELIPYVAITLVVAFTMHELAHAYVAYRFGDPTAKNQGRLTLNPLKHLDVFGTILIFVAGFGWARPVPVNRYHFKNPRLAGICVSIAGPLSNLVLAFLGCFVYVLLQKFGGESLMRFEPGMDYFFRIFINLNVILFLFNLLPLPPLDGYRIIEDVVSPRIRAKMTQFEQYGIIIFLIFVITPLGQFVFGPLIGMRDQIIYWFNLILKPLL
ncbi:site-2 protease family protein [Bacillus pumilus]|uniref:site-2 protease family protein n=1 Tax=Bacillus TaxID=1386 RepID=UPI0007761AB7|nr:site-2 protease family protein [Bacillus pumilus]AMM99034.1 zinc metalloprotease [Bacillus pumilus]MCY7678692.1 site-2 protease family protein [Bacillus pumilus]MCY9672538.1 site-2 protease family protein [Bacillus pumilus]MDH3149499.1 site-2 protease family protein [Bacillus pumilus]